ncbi:Smr/MutS family protein [Maritalea porphyrae]|jgi:DNA-nicking Smr family endonuclease|uniref:Smr/MutS family protein n=1 Tax=Maritalea porphyrae TaxID=880732 RepID=UPI0022B00C37|nr:Smr/MutS family protein [Maritalea porphyrae]MCZ4272248.1 Smr/MutS family protein [Maritalea porphyrae]
MSRAKKPPKDIADWHLWTEVTKSVSPLKPREQNILRVKRPELPSALDQDQIKRPRAKVRPLAKSWAPLATHIHNTDRHLPHFNSVSLAPKADKPMDQKLRRKIARGRISIDATLDLHGMRQFEAHSALIHFISVSFHRGDRNVLVITGKGVKRTGYAEFEQKGVLRNLVPRWLKEPALIHMVAGIDAAAQNHGGAGALYVRLKKASK